MKSKHYELKKKYYALLAADPDYPAWLDFEAEINGKWQRILRADNLWIGENNYRYNPLPKKWKPKGGWGLDQVAVSRELTLKDKAKLRAYATKLSWLREQGGYEFVPGEANYCISRDHLEICNFINDNCNLEVGETIYMSKEQAEKWLDMLNNGEV